MKLYNINYGLTSLLSFVANLSMLNAQGLDYSQCAIDANQSYWNAQNNTFLYDQYGKPTANISQAWGVSYESCKVLCGTPVNTGNYDWNSLSQGLTSWLLPWLALTAQLPFETKDKQTNFMALFLALGSPALITFSLALTILDARWINQKFRHIKETSESLRPDRRLQTEAIKAARVFLIESQHIPIQIVNGPHREFAQLVACPENWTWWGSLQKEIRKTKRQWTYSLYAQIGWVCVSQLLAIVDFFTTASFNTSIGIGLAINSLWIWMIPVVLGWVYIGTQTSAGSIKAALTSINVPVLGSSRDVKGKCIGIHDRTTSDESCTFLGFSIAGSELEPGPIFNYARIWSHMNAVQHVAEAFSAVVRRQEERRTVQGQPWNDKPGKQDENLRGSPEELSRYISIYEDGEDIPNFSIYGRSSPKLVLNCITAAFIAIFLQWSSTGAAIIIAYKTPVVGLGCQSGSYLVYGVVSTIAWLMLVLSASLSNRWSFQMERGRNPTRYILGSIAVITRLIGKCLAAANALFLVTTSAIQFTSLYDTCFCDACIFSLGRKAGWVILFASDAQIAAASKGAWIGGVSLSILSAAITTFCFLTSRGDEIFKRNMQ